MLILLEIIGNERRNAWALIPFGLVFVSKVDPVYSVTPLRLNKF